MTVQDGRLVLPSGMSYRLLVLSDARRMTPALLTKIKQLIEAGATVVGPRPLASPSLNNYPQCDDEVQRLAAEIWANCDGQTVQEHRLGLGRIVWGPTPEQVLERAGVRPDFSGAPLRYIHRRAEDTDIYFVANPLGQRVSASPTLPRKRQDAGALVAGERPHGAGGLVPLARRPDASLLRLGAQRLGVCRVPRCAGR